MRGVAVSFSLAPIISSKALAHARRHAGGKLNYPKIELLKACIREKEAAEVGSGLMGKGFPQVPQFGTGLLVRAGTAVTCSRLSV
jgi:hypothetical protein